MSAHLKIYEKVLLIYKDNFKHSTKEFKQGFEECLKLLHFGILKEPDYNKNLRLLELEREVRDKNSTIAALNRKINSLTSTVRQRRFVSSIPLDGFKYYQIKDAVESKSISLVTNMDRETFIACWYSFVTGTKAKKVDEAKSKFMNYINNNKLGFRAFKDVNSARREGIKI